MEVRSATQADLPSLTALREQCGLDYLFDSGVPTGTLVELCRCSVAVSEYGGILALACVASHFPGLDTAAVVHDVQLLVEDASFTPGNCALLVCAAVSAGVDGGAAGQGALLRELLVHALAAVPHVEHLLLVAPASSGLADYAELLAASPLQGLGCVRTPLAIEGARALYLLPSPQPPLLLRPARVEDFDDLAPIFEAHSEVVKGTFGEYFLAEVIEGAERSRDTRRVLVGERGGRAVGLISVTAAVPVGPMQHSFLTEPFGDLQASEDSAHAAAAAHSARAQARASSDWLQLLREHAQELPGLFATLPSAEVPGSGSEGEGLAGSAQAAAAAAAAPGATPEGDPTSWFGEVQQQQQQQQQSSEPSEPAPSGAAASSDTAVELSAFAELFNSMGDAWGFAGPSGARMGTMILVDTGLAPAGPDASATNAAFSCTRSAIAQAISALSLSRAARASLARLCAWYAPPGATGWGRSAVLSEWERAAASVEGGRKERLKTLQQGSSAAQKEVDAAALAERNVCDAAAKELYEREKAEKEKREGKPAKPSKPVSVASMPVPNTPAVLAVREAKAIADAKAEAATAAMVTAQSALSVPITVTLEVLAASLASNTALEPPSGKPPPIRDLLRELAPYLHRLPSPALTSKDLQAVLAQWEEERLGLCLSPSILVTCATGEGHPLNVPAGQAAAPEAGEAAVAAAAAAALGGAATCHLPHLMAEAASAFAAATAALAEAVARAAAAEEKRKAAEAEAAKAKEKGQPPPPAAKAAAASEAAATSKQPLTPAAAQAALDKLCDPLVDPLKGLTSYLTSGRVDTGRGLVLTGLPVHDASACARLAQALRAAGLPPALQLHAETLSAPKRFVSGGVTGQGKGRRPSLAPSAPVLLTAAPGRGVLGEALRHVCAEPGHLGRVAAGRGEGGAGDGAGAGAGAAQPLAQLVAVEVEAALQQLSLLGSSSGGGGRFSGGGSAASSSDFPPIRIPGASYSTAMAVDLFCVHSECEARCGDFLGAAFAEFPAMRYAVLAQPHASVLPPLLSHFMQVPPRPLAVEPLNTALFVCPRESLGATTGMVVRRATPEHRPALFALAQHSPDASDFRHCVVACEQRGWLGLGGRGSSSSSSSGTARLACFVAEVGGRVVGGVVLSNTGGSARALAAAAASFHLAPLLHTDTHATAIGGSEAEEAAGAASLLHAHVLPAFVLSTPHFLRQALALYGGKHALLYRCPPSPLGAHLAGSISPAILHAATLAAPRHLTELPPHKAQQRAQQAELDAAACSSSSSSSSGSGSSGWAQCDPITAAPFLVAGMEEQALWDPRNCAHALYVFSGRASLATQGVCNERIVVVGGGDAAVAALAQLLAHPSPRLPHLTLIPGPVGLAQAVDPYHIPAPFACPREYTAFDLARLPVTAHVSLLGGEVLRIHRKERVVVLSGGEGRTLRYDRLLLLPELSEPTAGYLGLSSPSALPAGMYAVGDAKTGDALDAAVAVLAASFIGGAGSASSSSSALIGSDGVYSGVSRSLEISGEDFGLDLHMQSVSLAAAEQPPAEAPLPSPASLKGCVLVYGDTLEAVSALAGLLDRGVPGSSIVCLLPPPPASGSSLPSQAALSEALAANGSSCQPPLTPQELHAGLIPDAPHSPPALFPAITAATVLRGSGVRTLAGVTLTSASLGQPGDFRGELTVSLSVGQQVLSVRPSLVLCCDARDVPGKFFTAVNDCGIVYDGRLVVDEHFCATDAAVYGGGSAAKFTRRLRNPVPLSEYSEVECGAAVAASVLRSLGCGGQQQQQQQQQPPLPPPGLFRARTRRCCLPGGYIYMRAKLPAYEMGGSGKDVCTVFREEDGAVLKHMRAVVDRYGYLAELCYIGTELVETRNLGMLPGLHSAFLSGLLRRAEAEAQGHSEGGFPNGDLVTFLREDWAEKMAEDSFLPFSMRLRAALEGDESVESLWGSLQTVLAGAGSGDPEVDAVVDAACADTVVGGVGVGGGALPTGTRQKVEKEVRAFLESR